MYYLQFFYLKTDLYSMFTSSSFGRRKYQELSWLQRSSSIAYYLYVALKTLKKMYLCCEFSHEQFSVQFITSLTDE